MDFNALWYFYDKNFFEFILKTFNKQFCGWSLFKIQISQP